MRCIVVSHTHWDREWYRTFEGFRARLIDTIDRVLELAEEEPDFRFLLDGQTIVLEDYLELRPERRADLIGLCRAGRIAIGPWYVQPDSLLPAGETHVRNLLEGRRVGEPFGGVSGVAYTPDSFGHPAQLPQLLAGFALAPFVYWRGNGNEIDDLPAEYLWEAPDGTTVLAHHLGDGYFGAAGLPDDLISGALFLEQRIAELGARTRNGVVLLMNGIDHAKPQAGVGATIAALRRTTGIAIERGLLEDFSAALGREAPRHRGELVGGRLANLLPGVWSARLPLKLENRRIESLLIGWAEPWVALAIALGARDERAAIRIAWRALLQNQAHDSICGCSIDAVHEQMAGRYATAAGLAEETTTRVLGALAGRARQGRVPWATELDVAVFNPSPYPRTDVVRFALDPEPWLEFRGQYARSMQLHPFLAAPPAGIAVDGRSARLFADRSGARVQLVPEASPLTAEFVVADVPAFGWRRVRLTQASPSPDAVDDGREIALDELRVAAAADGTLTVRFGDRELVGIGAVEDCGDRGDSYDFDPVAGDPPRTLAVEVERRIHPAGLQSLTVRRTLELPAALAPGRESRSAARARVGLEIEARLHAGVARVDLTVRLDNAARDHRLRLLFPTGAPTAEFLAATTFDVARRSTSAPPAHGWVHPPPTTFLQQGFVAAGDLTIAAPGLPEAEVRPDGVVAITLVRAVGWLARHDLRTRPVPAGPAIPAPGAQCLGPFEARLSLARGLDARKARDAELGLRAVAAGDAPLLPPGGALIAIDPPEVELSALKPAERGNALALRLLNPTDEPLAARVRLGFPIAAARLARLDETPLEQAIATDGDALRIELAPHALRTVLLSLAPDT